MFAASLSLAFTLAVSPFQGPPPLQHPHESGRPPEQLGKVQFDNSCAPAVGAELNRAVALLHSFWFGASAATFTTVAEKDPACGIAWWGVAMSRWGNPFAPSRPVAALEQGSAAIEKARAAGAKTEREKALIEAAATLFADFKTVDHRTRIVNYERAMQQVYDKYRQDDEIAAFYALAVNQTALPTDKTYAQQLKAAAILESLFARMPDHPGAAHYLIHAYDHPPLAEKALPAARRYASIAPDAPHALHMPSHTFTRVGHWEDSIATNRASADAARRANSPAEVLHAYDYQVYAYLQTAQDAEARRVMNEMREAIAAVNTAEQYGQVGYYAEAAIPARYALERGAWSEAAALQARSTSLPFIDAMTHFARAVGAARSGNAAAATADAQKLHDLARSFSRRSCSFCARSSSPARTSTGRSRSRSSTRGRSAGWPSRRAGATTRCASCARRPTSRTPPTSRRSPRGRSRRRARCLARCCSRCSAAGRRSSSSKR